MPYDITYEIEDEVARSAKFSVHVPTTFTLAQYTEAAQALAVLTDTIVAGILKRAYRRAKCPGRNRPNEPGRSRSSRIYLYDGRWDSYSRGYNSTL